MKESLQLGTGWPIQAVAFLLGVSALQVFRTLPDPYWLSFLPFILFFYVFKTAIRAIFIGVISFLWALFHAHMHFQHVLPETLAGQDLWVEGYIADIPKHDEKVQRFILAIEQSSLAHAGSFPKKIRVSWYGADQPIRAGEYWRLKVRLKPPHGFMNPGNFDYERWLYQNRIQATGYVRSDAGNQRIATQQANPVAQIRQWLSEQITENGAYQFGGMLTALAVGDRSTVDVEHWDLLKITGTNHLMAISGLHIGLVAGFMFWLIRRLCPLLVIQYIPAQRVAAVGALLMAFGYAMLAGFAIPTQRALVMLTVVFGAVLFSRHIRPGTALAMALIAVLIFDPVAVLAPGFWFSFLAVTVIAYSFSGRIAREPWFWQWARLQWVIAVALLPVSLFLFQQASLIAPLANLLLVPWVSFIVVPLTLLAMLLLGFSASLGHGVLTVADSALTFIWPVLEFLGSLPVASWQQAPPDMLMLGLAVIGVALLLAPQGLPQRWLGVVLLLPLALIRPPQPEPGDFWLSLLDVGQGLGIVIQTQQHSLIFDTGAKFSDSFDAGDRVLVPFLRYQGINRVDRLLISHGDNDHIGGAASVIRQIPIDVLMGQDVEKLIHPVQEPCFKGQSWEWDGVNFEVLHPDREYKQRNNRGCVLKVSNKSGSVLITADIEKQVEQHLLQVYQQHLRADVLIVPHHGSLTSSSQPFINQVSPKFALVSAGYMNRFRHPRPEIVRRYEEKGVKVLNTANQGAMSIKFNENSDLVAIEGYRKQHNQYWNHAL